MPKSHESIQYVHSGEYASQFFFESYLYQPWIMPFHQLFLISDTWTLNVEPKIYILYVSMGQRGRNCVRCPWCQGLLGGRPICSGRPVGSFRFPCHPRWATEPKIEASPINEDASLSAYLPRCMGDTSTQYATVINKKLCELCYMSAISSGKFQWIYRALLLIYYCMPSTPQRHS